MIVINQGRVNYCYKTSISNAEVCDTVCSNKVITIIIDYNLFIEKKVDKIIASLWDILTYTIDIFNLCNSTVENITLFDKIPENTFFIDNTVEINNVLQYGATPENLYIGDLEAKNKATITFKVAILKCYNEEINKITNLGEIRYDYLYNIEQKPAQMNLYTNEVITFVKCNNFSQLSTFSKTLLHSENFKVVKICSLTSENKVIKYKVIETNTGFKVLIIWKTYYFINYYKYNSLFGCTLEKEKRFDYFSTILNVPSGIKYVNKININILEEDCSYKLISKTNELNLFNTIFIYLN